MLLRLKDRLLSLSILNYVSVVKKIYVMRELKKILSSQSMTRMIKTEIYVYSDQGLILRFYHLDIL